MAAAAKPLDLRDPRDEIARAPSNLEVEQGFLGAALYDNACVALLSDTLRPEHFYEPFHGRLWRAIARSVRLGLAADPQAIAEEFRRDAAYNELGGIRYLADLVDKAPTSARAAGYAELIIDLALRRDLIRIAGEIAARAQSEYADADDEPVNAKTLAEAMQADLAAIQLQSGRERLAPLSEVARGSAAHMRNKEAPPGVLSGLGPLDLALGPMAAGDLILLGARPSMGKSALAGAFSLGVGAPNLADFMNGRHYDNRRPAGVIEIHGEMSYADERQGGGGQVARRHLSNLGFARFGADFPTYRAMRDRKVSFEQAGMVDQVVAEMGDPPIVGIKRTGLMLQTLRSMVLRQATAWERIGVPLGLVVVDHVGLMKGSRRRASRYEEQSEISQGLKELADELHVPILALVQLNRDLERRDDKRPQVGDLRDSGRWEEDADAILFLYRAARYAQLEPDLDAFANREKHDDQLARRTSREVDVSLAKLREGDSGKTIKLWGDLAHNAIRGMEPDYRAGRIL